MQRPRFQMGLLARSQVKQLRQVAELTVARKIPWFLAQSLRGYHLIA
jgi:hypothetical protein